MFDPISWLKYRLSHISQDSWHFRITKNIWGERYVLGKACSYYWYKLPVALAIYGFILIFIVTGGLVGGFLGFILNLKEEGTHGWFHPYKTLPNGRRFPVAPWELTVLAVSAFALYQLAVVHPTTGAYLGKIALIVIVGISLVIGAIVAISFGISKNWSNPAMRGARQAVVDAWNKVYPELVPEDRSQGAKGEHPQTSN